MTEDDARDIDDLASGLNLKSHGAFEQSDLAGAELDWAAFPSIVSESWSFVLDEAIALGLPVIVPDRGALGERVGQGGVRFVAGDSDSLRDAIAGILEDRNLAGTCRERLPELVTMEHHAERLETLYWDHLIGLGELPQAGDDVARARIAHLARRFESRFRSLLDLRGRLETEQGRSDDLEANLLKAESGPRVRRRSRRSCGQ